MNFWFTSCGPCIAEMPVLNAWVSKYSKDQVVFIGFALEDRSTLKSFLKHLKFNYVIVPKAKSIHEQYQITTCPVSVIIDQHGVISYISDSSDEVKAAFAWHIRELL